MSLNPNDIPEALRDRPVLQPASRSGGMPLSLGVGLGLGGLALAAATFLLWRGLGGSEPVRVQNPPPPPAASPSPAVENVLGHLAYAAAPSSELRPITRDGEIQLRQIAADSFLKMQAAARTQGLSLLPLSGFRTLDQQNHLFFEVQRQRNQDPRQRAEVSAPPGYSEHHTGYAIDIGDGAAPATNLSTSFEKTRAFQWLRQNAHRFSFEMSFPPNNPQGVSYEPWHWRFVGDRASLETFYKARQLSPSN